MKRNLFLGALCVASLSACVSAPKPQLLHEPSVHVWSGDAAEQMIVIRIPQKDAPARVCLAPFPDALTSASAALGLRGALGGQGAGISEGVSRGAVGLGGRSADVLLVRELLYRACELSANIEADPAGTLQIYERVFRLIESISQSQTEVGTASSPGGAPSVEILK
jgi:hypothetical protein